MYPCLSQDEWTSSLEFPTQVRFHGAWQSTGPAKKLVTFLNKKDKQNLFESYSENESLEFPRFIILELLEETSLAKLSSFFIEKIISSKANQVTIYLWKRTSKNMLKAYSK